MLKEAASVESTTEEVSGMSPTYAGHGSAFRPHLKRVSTSWNSGLLVELGSGKVPSLA
jgi:hypothetical protein